MITNFVPKPFNKLPMKRFNVNVAIVLLALMAMGCSQNRPFISDAEYLTVVEQDLEAKTQALDQPQILAVLDDVKGLSLREHQALKFLYAYMPLGDMVDYSTDFYLQNIRQSFVTQNEMPWGQSVPEELFRHFVLPVRVNNENLDSSRMVFYRELKDRVVNLPMREAILEVNHWCHEKVTYQPSDARTSSPLASVRTAYGRCGEESTFTVAALRAVGIPARQVYTPRWAHTDDNHAWVEAWAEGEWHYIGACEPAPELSMGWFDAPAKRALLLHTRVFGRYNGPEDIMQQTNAFAEINITSNYAPTAKAVVTIVDKDGNPVADADVRFGIYNYAEFFPVLSAKSSTEGITSITAGKGSMSVWAAKDGMIGFDIISVGSAEEFVVALNFSTQNPFSQDFDIVPPAEARIERSIPQTKVEATNFRMAQNDSIRSAYIASFIANELAEKIAEDLNADKDLVVRYLKASRGNWSEIEMFLRQVEPERMDLALQLLGQVAAKDLRDTPADVLLDHLRNVEPQAGNIFLRYVLNPRVGYEMLTPYRSWFQSNLPEDLIRLAKENPANLVEWASGIKVRDDYNPQRIPMSPVGVMKLGVADARSKNFFFVAVCRSLGIPARLEEVTGQLQYFHDGTWHNVNFEQTAAKAPTALGYINLKYTPTQTLENPQYDTHFTLSRIVDGQLQRLNFRETEGYEGTVSWKSRFAKPVALDEGAYLLITGSRQENGNVLARVEMFRVKAGATTSVNLKMRIDEVSIKTIGTINTDLSYRPASGGKAVSLDETSKGSHFVLAIMGAGQEPSNHAIRDFIRHQVAFEQWGIPIVILFGDASQWDRFTRDGFKNLPSNTVFGIDDGSAIAKELVSRLGLSTVNDLPIVVFSNGGGEVTFASQGYRIGLGDQLLKNSNLVNHQRTVAPETGSKSY